MSPGKKPAPNRKPRSRPSDPSSVVIADIQALNLGSREYRVCHATPLPEDTDGLCETGVIRLNPSLKTEFERSRTLLHETLHAISQEWNLELSEEQVLGLESGFSALARLNPKASAAIFAGLVKS